MNFHEVTKLPPMEVSMEDAVILACARSPMTKAKKGALALARIDDVGAQVIARILERVPAANKDMIEDVLIGCAIPEGEQGLNVARNIALLASLSVHVGAVTINRFCASSLEAINQAAQAIRCENGHLFVAGGIESMSHVPMGGFNRSLNERLMRNGAPKAYVAMGLTAENLAKKYSITRDAQDGFALMSHMKAISAWQQGKFGEEVVSIRATGPGGEVLDVMKDELPRPDASMDALAGLAPAFLKDGTVTAGNSSPLTDGAAMVIMSSKKFAKRMKIKPLARIRAMAVCGVDPEMMGEGPICAVPKALRRAKMKLSDVDLIELNEAFAAQAIAVIKELGVDDKKVNVNGGAIALGHPLGASGARIITTLINAMIDRGAETGLATMCVGGGQGVATVIERV